MSLMNLATVFGPSLLRPPVAGLGAGSVPVDISQEVVVQVSLVFYRNSCVHHGFVGHDASQRSVCVPGAGGVLVPAVPRPP